jgi:hypothetical protein
MGEGDVFTIYLAPLKVATLSKTSTPSQRFRQLQRIIWELQKPATQQQGLRVLNSYCLSPVA